MLDFIDTKLFDKTHGIRVIVYSDKSDSAKSKVNSLIEGENVVSKKEFKNGIEVVVNKDGLQISIITMYLGQSARGYRTTYSLVDRSILSMENGLDIFYNVIKPANVIYSHVLSEQKQKPNITIMLF